jgi:4-amino-4-deoxy-L-arabinose transferase-like glycosyltransferase
MALLHRILTSKNTIWYLLLLALLCRVAIALSIDPLGSDTVDGFDYHNHAISLLNGEGYPDRGSLPFMRPPLYPILLSIVYYFLPHDTYITARLVNAVLDIAACFVFYKLILLVWDSRRVALLSTLVYAVNPLILFFTARVRVEALFTLLLVSFTYVMVKSLREHFSSKVWMFLAGFLIGLATLARPNALLVIGLIPLWLVYANWRKWNEISVTLACFVLGCCITILPWTARNYSKYGEFILASDAFGYSFWISNSDLKVQDLKATTHQEYLDADKQVWEQTAATEKVLVGKSVRERERYYTNLGLSYIKENTSTWLLLNVFKFVEFWWPMGRIDMQGIKSFATLPFGLLVLFGLVIYVGKLMNRSIDTPVYLLFAILFLSATVSGVMHWSSIRYRIPMVDAYLIPFFINWALDRSGIQNRALS